MKLKLLLSLLAVAAVATGCKKEIEPTPEPPVPQTGDMIRLNGGTFGSALISKADPTVRTEEGFIAGDLIGVTAVFSKKQAGNTDADEPNWGVTDGTNRHFTNEQAIAKAPVTPAVPGSFTNEFAWDSPQFYPQGRNIFLYAYYPYHDGSTDVSSTTGVEFIKNDGTNATEPDSLKVTLRPETLTESAKTLTQPDVMVASHAKATATPTPASINRISAEADTRLQFRHLLAQLQFAFCKEEQVKNDVTVKALTVYMPPVAKFPVVSDDAMSLGVVPVASGGTDPDYTQFVKYTFTPSAGSMDPIPVKTEDPQLLFTTGETPFMTLPLSLDQMKAYCKIVLEVDMGEYGTKEFVIKGDVFTAALAQGKVNTIKLTINYVLVTLTATVSPWGTDGSEIDIPVE